MKERPILFSGPMVRAILSGAKTQTRRVVKSQPSSEAGEIFTGWYHPTVIDRHGDEHPGPETYGAWTADGEWGMRCPYGQPGDRLWVRESWAPDPPCDGTWGYTSWAGCREGQIAGVPDRFRSPKHCIYSAEWSGTPLRWTPSIHMPRWASRILLEVTGVRVERLQDISEADAVAEGVKNSLHLPGGRFANENFAHLWWTINGDGSWDSNPWVWVIDFKQMKGGAA
jgi:hypothetical protein